MLTAKAGQPLTVALETDDTHDLFLFNALDMSKM